MVKLSKYSTKIVYFFLVNLSVGLGLLGAQEKEQILRENLGPNVNSPYDEQNPVLSPDGKTMYYTRVNHPNNKGGVVDKGDIWFTRLDLSGNWSVAQNLGRPLNDKFINGIIGFSPDGNFMYLRNNYINDHKNPIQQGVSLSRKSSDGWSYPENVQIKYFMNKSEEQSMSISPDGKAMLMSIESYGTYGLEDIYVSFLNGDGTWTEPLNLGSTINTAYHEMTPSITADNSTLFFSSNGHGGFGSKDIFKSQRLDDTWKKWSAPENLGPPINTEGMEMSYFESVVGGTAFVVSTQNSDGYGDINKIKIEQQEVVEELPVALVIEEKVLSHTFEGNILELETNKRLDATLTFTPRQPDEVEVVKIKTSNGSFKVDLADKVVYTLDIESKGHLYDEERISLVAPFRKDYWLLPLEVGTTVKLKHVLFETATTILVDSAYKELDLVVRMMQKNPNMEIELGGHTDNRGNARLNYILSDNRVKTVKSYLVDQGISADRIIGKAYGGIKPIASNKTEESRRLNRRVEFTILKE